VQINKTSRNTVLFMTNIGTTRSSVAYLVEVLVKIAAELEESISEMGLSERARFEQTVRRLTTNSAPLPNFSGFHPVFRDGHQTPEGDVRRAFYLSYDDTNCEYLSTDEIFDKIDAGVQVVSATFVTPYPPGFPVLVPGQVFSQEILTFLRELDTPEIHGYKPELGFRVYTEKAIERLGPDHWSDVPQPSVIG
jgi:arginine decarboxylase